MSTNDREPRARAPHDRDAHALLRLVACSGPASPRRALLECCGTPSAALAAGIGAWRECGLDAAQVQALRQPDPAALDSAERWLDAPGHAVVGWHDPAYPPLLRRIASPPLALFVDGDATLAWRPAIAIVGSRAPTTGGRDNAFAFARTLAAAGLVIASGLAAGIDAAAHRGALAAPGATLAVLGTGPDVAYPAGHADLLQAVADSGVVVSEHLPGTGPRREHFPSRNRILAGLSLGTLVVEAAHRSGALITARLAADAGREVFALPGSIHNPKARGCHRLIRDGAQLVESAQDVLDALAPLVADTAADLRARLRDDMDDRPITAAGDTGSASDPDYNRLWDALCHDPSPMDALVARTGLTTARLSSMLLLMELEGRVAIEHGRYSRRC